MLSFLVLSAVKLLLLLEGRIIFEILLVVLESPRNFKLFLDRVYFWGMLQWLIGFAETVEPLPLFRLEIPSSLGDGKLLIHRHR